MDQAKGNGDMQAEGDGDMRMQRKWRHASSKQD